MSERPARERKRERGGGAHQGHHATPHTPRPGKKGEAERFEKAKVRRAGFKRAAYIRIVKCAIRLVVLFCVGTAVFTFGFEWKWDDALWYTVVTCSTVGYGDILPTTDNEKVAAMVIILVGTVTVTQALGEFVDLYVVIFTEVSHYSRTHSYGLAGLSTRLYAYASQSGESRTRNL